MSNKTKQCPICKKMVDEKAIKCPYCKSDLTVGGNITQIITSIGVILTLCITVPAIMFGCGMCSLGAL